MACFYPTSHPVKNTFSPHHLAYFYSCYTIRPYSFTIMAASGVCIVDCRCLCVGSSSYFEGGKKCVPETIQQIEILVGLLNQHIELSPLCIITSLVFQLGIKKFLCNMVRAYTKMIFIFHFINFLDSPSCPYILPLLQHIRYHGQAQASSHLL